MKYSECPVFKPPDQCTIAIGDEGEEQCPLEPPKTICCHFCKEQCCDCCPYLDEEGIAG